MPVATGDPLADELMNCLRRSPQLADRSVLDVHHMHQRSQCSRLTLDDGCSVFVKRATLSADGTWSADVVAEGRILAELESMRVPAPRLLLLVDEPDTRLIAMEDLADGRALDLRRRQDGGTSVPVAAELGGALAAVHRHTRDGRRTALPDGNRAEQVARALTVLTPTLLTRFPAGYAELNARIRAAGLVPALQSAVAHWRAVALVHGDVKSDNVLCRPRAAGADRVALIDWELAGWGDPRWDVGAMIGDYLYGWLTSMRFESGRTLADWIASAEPSLPQIRGELRAALAAYTAVHAADDGDRRLWMGYAAMFLLQRAQSSAVHARELPPSALALLQVAGQLLHDPDSALENLL